MTVFMRNNYYTFLSTATENSLSLLLKQEADAVPRLSLVSVQSIGEEGLVLIAKQSISFVCQITNPSCLLLHSSTVSISISTLR